MPIVSGGAPPTRVRYPNDVLAAFGLLTETVPRPLLDYNATSSSGDYRFGGIGLEAGDIVTNVHIFSVGSGGTAVTLAKAGLYRATTLALLRASANEQAQNWAAGAWHTLALTTPLTITTTGLYYVGCLFVGADPPAVATGGSIYGMDVAQPPNGLLQLLGRQTGLADLPDPLVPAVGNIAHHYAVS